MGGLGFRPLGRSDARVCRQNVTLPLLLLLLLATALKAERRRREKKGKKKDREERKTMRAESPRMTIAMAEWMELSCAVRAVEARVAKDK